ncbi:AMP-binding protein [Paraburkholderia saeva]|uniref:Bile acid-coenzyme A ligase n=1 Tax=Paraburkholderia saeva TaxID=2777537 RepID=A0A9N8RWB8_9BURK|nr:AMP-binding protein [Paraburkholderia saeva]CAG4896583.1 Bile acid-coenzyme A ligase [Paraburkholderia saeva]CAG4910689.1 Bile acid-coenzyme A ligase [Paraburkholderia saeva]
MSLRSIASIIQDNAQRKGSAPAITYPDGTLTWSDLDRRSNQRARLLKSLGVKRDDLVAVMLPNGSEFHEAVVAVWKAGATPCILPSKLPGREAGDVLALAQPAAVIGDVPVAFDGARIAPRAALDQFDVAPMEEAGAAHWKAVASGGSSGRPKIIVDTMPAFIDPAAPPFAGFGFPAEGAMLNPGPLYHNMPFLFTSFGMMAGSHVVGMSRFDAEECLRLIELHRIEFVALVPTMMQRIWALPENVRTSYDLSSLRVIWHMGAPCPQWLKRAWIEWLGPHRIFEAYGGTEAGGCVITGHEWLKKPGSVGKAAPGGLRILREDGSEADTGEIGEVHFPATGKGRFRYIGAEAKEDATGSYSIGDLGHLDEDGYVFLADRRSDLILRGGANIYPAEVEAVLDEHPLVSTSAVIGLPDHDLGERVHAIIQLREGEQLDLKVILAHVEDRLSKYKWPSSYEVSDTPLRDDAGKVRRTLLKAERLAWLEAGRSFKVVPAK